MYVLVPFYSLRTWMLKTHIETKSVSSWKVCAGTPSAALLTTKVFLNVRETQSVRGPGEVETAHVKSLTIVIRCLHRYRPAILIHNRRAFELTGIAAQYFQFKTYTKPQKSCSTASVEVMFKLQNQRHLVQMLGCRKCVCLV